jgi:hypothetical protein
MMHSSSKVAVFLAVLLGAAMLSAQTGAMLHVSGKATLNGITVGDSSTIFAGDRLVTADGAMATINQPGLSVVVASNSSILYGKGSVDILQGTARINATDHVTAQAGKVTAVSKDGSTLFEVARLNDKVTITSREGAVAVSDGSQTVTVASGNQTTFPVAGSTGLRTTASAQGAPSGVAADGPFYKVSVTNDDLPICASWKLCQRSSVSQIRPCKCP